MTPQWIFFDLDDTLFDFSSASLASLQNLWKEEDAIRRAYASPEAFIDEYHIHNKHMWELHERGEISAEFLKAERFRLTVAPSRHDAETIDEMKRLNHRYLTHLGMCDAKCPGAAALMERLRGKCMIGILTNGFTEVQYNKLRSTGLDKYIQRMVISDEIGIQKPDERLFRYAEQATGAEHDRIVMVGDNPDNDIAGALAAGWKAIYYDRKEKRGVFDSPNYLGRITDLNKLDELCGL